jgi:DNA-binding NarL/FixJ family response regulator
MAAPGLPDLTRMAKKLQQVEANPAVQKTSSPREPAGSGRLSVDGKNFSLKRVVVADEAPICRCGLKHFFGDQPDLSCVAEAGSAEALLRMLEADKPDFLVMGLRFSYVSGLDLIKIVRGMFPALPILVLSELDETVYAERVLRAGANGFIRKNEPLSELLNAVHCILDGELYLSRKMSALILRHSFREKAGSDPGLKALSDRELYVFRLLGAGLSSRKIALQLGVSLKTIESHRENIKRKLGLHDGAELLRHAVHFVDPPLRALAQSLTACASKPPATSPPRRRGSP